MINNKGLAEIEARLGLALQERNGPNTRLLLEHDIPALLKNTRELFDMLVFALEPEPEPPS